MDKKQSSRKHVELLLNQKKKKNKNVHRLNGAVDG